MDVKMKITKRKIGIIIGLLVLLIMFAVSYFMTDSESFAKPRIKPVVDLVYGLGTVKAEKTFNLRLNVNAQLLRVYVSEGDMVIKGESLIMTDSGIVLKAPFSGVITSLFYKEGESVTGTQPVLTLVDTSNIYVLLSLDQDSVIMVKKGQKAELSFENLRDKKVEGIVSMVYPSNGEFLVKIIIPRLQSIILPGMTVDTVIAVGNNDKACLVPKEAVKDGVVIVSGKSGNRTESVEPGIVDGSWVEIACSKVEDNELILILKK